MKYLLAACAAAMTLTASAFAEEAAAPPQPQLPAAAASACPAAALPADPTLPDGATANSAAMNAGNASYQTWIQAIRPSYDCHREEYRQALSNLRAREAELRPLNDKVQGITNAWEAEAAEFNARPARERR